MPSLAYVGMLIEKHLNEIHRMFDERAKVTLVVRMPWLPDGDLVMTIDDLAEVEAAIRKRREGAAASEARVTTAVGNTESSRT